MNRSFLVKDLSPEQFLVSNRDDYYCWYLPAGDRGSLSFTARGIEYGRDGAEPVILSSLLPSPPIAGVKITGYFIPSRYLSTTRGIPLFVTDTLYDMRDPYSTEDPQEEPGRVTNMRDFVKEFYSAYPLTIDILAQSLFSMSMREWYNRIDAIWNRRVALSYPVVGLVLWSRNEDVVYVWRDVQFVTTQMGDRIPSPSLGFEVPMQTVVPPLSPYTLDWNDISGNGTTIIEWGRDTVMLERMRGEGFSSILLPNSSALRREHLANLTGVPVGNAVGEFDASSLVRDPSLNEYLASVLVLAPRQKSYLTQLSV